MTWVKVPQTPMHACIYACHAVLCYVLPQHASIVHAHAFTRPVASCCVFCFALSATAAMAASGAHWCHIGGTFLYLSHVLCDSAAKTARRSRFRAESYMVQQKAATKLP